MVIFLSKFILTVSVTKTGENKLNFGLLNFKANQDDNHDNQDTEFFTQRVYQTGEYVNQNKRIAKHLPHALLLKIQRKTKNCMKYRKLCLLYA